MADFIVIRLVPPAPVDAATFETYLKDLTVKVYDISYAHPGAGTPGDATAPIGSASYDTPTVDPLPSTSPPFVTYPAGTRIVQHYDLLVIGPAVVAVDFASVATAVIPAPAGASEYVTSDLRVVLERAGMAPVFDGNVYYDVAIHSGAAPTLDQYPSLPASTYLTVPATADPNLAQLKLPSDGTPPNYDALLTAIDKVVAADPGTSPNLAALVASKGPLTAGQAKNIAYEILWGSQPALPATTDPLEKMYTNPPNSGATSDSNEQARQQFEGSLNSYYATRSAQAEQLSKFVFSASAAIWCEQQSKSATSARLRFPTNPAGTSALTTVATAEVLLTGALAIDIPALYFYALTAQLPTQLSPQQRFKMTVGTNEQSNLTQLTAAVEAKIITVPAGPAADPSQAVRMLAALLVPPSSTLTQCPLAAIQPLWSDWLAYKPADWRTYLADEELTTFWPGEVGKPVPVPKAFVELVLYALTEGYVIANSGPAVLLADDIRANLQIHTTAGVAVLPTGVDSVDLLSKALASDWQAFFESSPLPPGAGRKDLLPPFTKPGGITAFIQHVRKFFDMPTPIPTVGTGPGGGPALLDGPTTDWIEACIAALGGLVFGTPFTAAEVVALQTAAATVFPGDLAAQEWAVQTLVTINELAGCAKIAGTASALQFSIIEALFARGFTGSDSILARPFEDFQQALIGTVAYEHALEIYTNAGAPPAFPSPGVEPFAPVNDGSLRNCVPPDHLSPLGPVAYLHEMLRASEASTCLAPAAPPAAGHMTLEKVVDARRGPLGSLQVTRANLETPLPLIDIVNECLEFMGSTVPPIGHGTVYGTAAEALGSHVLCEESCRERDCGDGCDDAKHCHRPPDLFAALPQHATPATPGPDNAAVEPAVYDILKTQLSACCLPYSQALDVSRSYVRQLQSCRYEALRAFRKCITEFVHDPNNEPAGFQDHLWRYPVRIDSAIEYLGITPEEFAGLFQGVWPRSCGEGEAGGGDFHFDTVASPSDLYGFPPQGDERLSWPKVVTRVPEFLTRTCLSYCELVDLWRSGYVPFTNAAAADGAFPDCEPCCLGDLSLQFPAVPGASQALVEIMVFVRLWRKLKDVCGARYSFTQLADICSVLHLFDAGGNINPDFLRQLAAFQILRDQFQVPLEDRHTPGAVGAAGADRTHLLALWVGPAAPKWSWAVATLIRRIAEFARCHHGHDRDEPDSLRLLPENLDPLSRLAGFDPGVATDSWHAAPTHTLRFAEVLGKICASRSTVGELLFLFTADEQLDGDEPFALQFDNEALDMPLDLPDEEERFSLAHLRHRLLETNVSDEECHEWSWKRVEAYLTDDVGFEAKEVLELGVHLFPGVVRRGGTATGAFDHRYVAALAPASTNPAMWGAPLGGPFQYEAIDAATGRLWTAIPLRDHAVLEQLTHVRPLGPEEREAVQSLYFQPRAALARFAFLFPSFPSAEHHLLEERDENERWKFFQRHVALTRVRHHAIAKHLTEHVAAATAQPCPDDSAVALLVLRHLFADENKALSDWQTDDSGAVPTVTWKPPPCGGALPALLGLTGTGLLREYKIPTTGVVWRDLTGTSLGFGHQRDEHNAPVPTVVPALDLALSPEQLRFVSVKNGLAMDDTNDHWLGGGQEFEVSWKGALLVDCEGTYEFRAGAAGHSGEGSEHHGDEFREKGAPRKWRVVLKRGQKTWILLAHGHRVHEPCDARVTLKRGIYEIHIQFEQPPLAFPDDEDVRRQRTGFRLEYTGPDTKDALIEIPHNRLFCVRKDADLSVGIHPASADASAFLRNSYYSSLRDIRRTYQRAFKAVLLSHRLALSAHAGPDGHSELGYILSQPVRFAGAAYHRTGAGYVRHLANFDFNLLPLRDNYCTPSPAEDSRVEPSLQRKQALFDWWERLWDYGQARRDVRKRFDRHLWRLFDEAETKKPLHPAYLLRHLGADERHWDIDTRFYQDQNTPVYRLTSDDCADERWVLRSWHADRVLCAFQRQFTFKDITQVRPDLWVSLDPGAVVALEAETGNGNLTRVVGDGLLENGEPSRYEDLERLNDGLRERGRKSLLAYLCGINGIVKSPKELSELLLLDVEAGPCERATRIDDAIIAVQLFIKRARIGLEPGWVITKEFAALWDSRFASFHVWEACRRRELYKENWIDWHEFEKARKIESFDFLEAELRRATLTIAAPGGLDYWPDQRPPAHPSLTLLQRRDPDTMKQLDAPREGLNLLATPDRAAVPSWLTTVGDVAVEATPTIPGTVDGHGAVLAMVNNAGGTAPTNLPLWMKAAMRLGRRFLRIAAAGYPPAATPFALASPQRTPNGKERCVDCCTECGCSHPNRLDEYYFWLVDAQKFDEQTQNSFYDHNTQEATPWHDDVQLKALLQWPAQPTVRLAWCRVHNGDFQPPRRSVEGIEASSAGASVPDLELLGRMGDSLYFHVTNAATAAAPNPGFRYDLATDTAEADDDLTLPVAPPGPFPGGLVAYPYFAYFDPGARLFPWSLFTPAIAVAEALRTHCRFEAALKWYELAYSPLASDNAWIDCEQVTTRPRQPTPDSPPKRDPEHPRAETIASVDHPRGTVETAKSHGETEGSACCDATDISCEVARHRSVLLHYLETLLLWGDADLKRNSPEAFQNARLLFDTSRRILGPKPHTLLNVGKGALQTVASFVPLVPPLNPRLIDLYEQVEDRLELVHACLNARRLKAERLRCEPRYWGDDPVRHGWESSLDSCGQQSEWCYPASPYRFVFLVQKAQELAGRVRELGSALLSAIEKGDAEYLASVRQRQEHELLAFGRKAREDQWRDADWQVQALGKTKESDQASRRYYAQLISNGLIPNELQYVMQTGTALDERMASNIIEGIAEIMAIIPDIFVGFPCNEMQLPVGTKLAGLFRTIAKVTTTLADIAGTTASLDLTQAGWDRRLQDWVHQVEVLDIQIEQVELQILGAERRRDQALRDLNSQERQIENAKETLDLLRDKFSSHATYLWLQKETAQLHHTLYELALHTARQAEKACNLELGHATRRFLPDGCWNSLREGLLAGERLQVCLSQMEKEYLDRNVREHELSTDFSLRCYFPMEFLRLKLTGCCEIEIPEWMFDLQYPGHYMRRIKNVSLTIPCVVGPYTGIHCRLTLLSSQTRIDPTLGPANPRCCSACKIGNDYDSCPHDRRMVHQYGAQEAIATSRGQNDSGLFELSFRDERSLPFEFAGSTSRWRIELPPDNNFFDMDTLNDVILHMNYTAREGGNVLAHAAREATNGRLPDCGWRLFDVQHDFPDAWAAMDRCKESSSKHHHKELHLRFERDMFPFIPGSREVAIDKLGLLFEVPGCGYGDDCEIEECPCRESKAAATHEVELAWAGKKKDSPDGGDPDLQCARSLDWPSLYHGTVETPTAVLGAHDHGREARFRFPVAVHDLSRVYLLCHYVARREPCSTRESPGAAGSKRHASQRHERRSWPHEPRG